MSDKYASVLSREGNLLRAGTYVQRLPLLWKRVQEPYEPKDGANYIIEDVKDEHNGLLCYVKLRNHFGWLYAHDFTLQPWGKPGWSLTK